MTAFKYRPDIDGLRAIAVIAVVLFHAGFGLDGGFIGVDIFFVISGYLISGLIFKQQESEKFRLKEFWLRRIRRIVPASIVMTVCTVFVAGLVMLPKDYEGVGKAAYWHQLMGANIHFWNHSGYFDGDSEMHPLLHTWSLAVEEQFYLFYPFLLWFLAKRSVKTRTRVLWGLFAVSLIGSEWLVRFDSVSAFYLLPSRAWELLLGGLLWTIPGTHGKQSIKEIGSVAALLIMLGCCWGFPWEMNFPGFSAMIPCFAAALFIYSNSGQLTRSGKILASRPLVFIGLLSYSLYLWHWPLMVFAKYRFPGQVTPAVMMGLVAVSFALAYLSWRFIETPFRRKILLPTTRQLLTVATCVPVAIICSGVAIDVTEGLPSRLPPTAAKLFRSTLKHKYYGDMKLYDIENDRLPNHGDPEGSRSVLVWGDSHAMAIMPAIAEECKRRGWRCYQITEAAHPPTMECLENSATPFQPDEFNQAAFEFMLRNKIDQVVLAGYWRIYIDSSNFESALTATVDKITSEGVPVILFEDVATFGRYDTQNMVQLAWEGKEYSHFGITLEEHREANLKSHRILSKLESPMLKIYDPTKYFIDENGFWPLTENGISLFVDHHHLSLQGNEKIKPLVKQVFDEIPVRTAASDDRVIK